VSETFVRAWTAPGEIRQPTVKAYLLVIARIATARGCVAAAGFPRFLGKNRISPIRVRRPCFRGATRRAGKRHGDLQRLPELDRTALLMSAVEEMSYDQLR